MSSRLQIIQDKPSRSPELLPVDLDLEQELRHVHRTRDLEDVVLEPGLELVEGHHGALGRETCCGLQLLARPLLGLEEPGKGPLLSLWAGSLT